MKRFLCALFLCLFLATSGWAGPGRAGEVIFRGDRNFAPFEYVDEQGRPAGFDVDILTSVAEVMGMKVRLELGPWETVRRELEEGHIDALVGMRHSDERDRVLDFSAPYLINTSAIFVREGAGIRDLEDLEGREVLVQRGDIMDDFLQALPLSANVVFVKSQEEALRLLVSGRHDAALCSRLRGLYMVHALGLKNLRAVGPELAAGPYGFAVREGDTELLALLNEGLRVIKATGRYEDIYRKWFGLYDRQSLLDSLYTYILWVLLPVLLFLAAVLIWTWTLRRQVRKKTAEMQEQLDKRRLAEARLADEKRFRELIEASPVGMAIVDSEQSVLYLNATFREMFGYTLRDIPDTSTFWETAFQNPEHRQIILSRWQECLDAPPETRCAPQPFEVDITCRDGALRHVACSLAAVSDGYILVLHDITPRVRAENALAYRSRVEAMVAGISTRLLNLESSELDEEVRLALQQLGEVIGVDRSYIFECRDECRILSNTHEWCAPGIEPQRERLQELAAEELPWFLDRLEREGVFQCSSVEKLGQEAAREKHEWMIEGIKSLITVPMVLKGEMVGFIGFDSVKQERSWPEEIPFLLQIVAESFANALERRRFEEFLRAAHRQLEDIIDFLPDATFVIDDKGEVVAWNRAIEKMTGIPKKEMLGKGDFAYAVPFYGERRQTLADLILHPEWRQEVAYPLLLDSPYSLVSEVKVPALYGGRGAYVWAKASALFDQEGELAGAIESIRDITERRQAQERLEASNRELESFVYTASHDLRSPLTPIIGYADYLMETCGERLDAGGRQCLEAIDHSARKMLALLEDLLALAQVGHVEAPQDAVDTGAVLQEVLKELQPQLEQSGVQVHAEFMPRLHVPKTLLYQVLLNLLGNALRYAGKAGGPIVVGGDRERKGQLYVRDHGPGIPEEDRSRIFDVFFRGQNSRLATGTGIGLATVQKIAQLYGGSAFVEETPGGGATFRVEFGTEFSSPT